MRLGLSENYKTAGDDMKTQLNEFYVKLIAEIIDMHDNILVWDEDSKRLKKVECVSLNGDCIQLTIEKWEKGE